MSTKLAAVAAALKEGRKADAVELIGKVLTAEPQQYRHMFKMLLHLLLDLRQYQQGTIWGARALDFASNDYEVLNFYGAHLRLAGRRAEALKIFDRAIRLRPSEFAAHVNKGHTYNDLRNGPLAEEIFSKLVRQHPRDAEFQRALARAFLTQDKVDAAYRHLRISVNLNPKNVNAWLDLAAAAGMRDDYADAQAILDDAITRLPDHPRLYIAKVTLLRRAGLDHDAKAFLTSLLPRFGDQGWLHHELARTLPHEDAEQSLEHHRRAVECAPHDNNFRLALAEFFMRRPKAIDGKNIDDAYVALMDVPSRSGLDAIGTMIASQILTRVADFDALPTASEYRMLGRECAQRGHHGVFLEQFAKVETLEDRRDLIEQHKVWGDRLIARAELNPINRPTTRPSSKIRIGFMSSDLREHPVTYFAWPLFEHLDRSQFEVYCYSFSREPAGPLQNRISSMVDAFRWTPQIGDREAAQMIADDQLDILFELGGSTYMNKVEVMAWKPAAITASWMGYPHSVGLSTIDYLLVDPFINPPDPDLLIEKPLIMPRCWIAMSNRVFRDEHIINPVAPFRRHGRITFGTANATYKYTAGMLRVWARVVAAVPGSRFIFLRGECGSETFKRNVTAIFESEGVDADRVDFRAIAIEHIPHYNDIDIALDTFPQTGGTTTCEAAWMGVPTITLVGEALYERMSYSILTNIGLGDLCAFSEEGFIQIAVALAADNDRIQRLRTALREQIKTSPFGNPRQFAADFYALVKRTVLAYRGETAALEDQPHSGAASQAAANELSTTGDDKMHSSLTAAHAAFAAGRTSEAVDLMIAAFSDGCTPTLAMYQGLVRHLIGLRRYTDGLEWSDRGLEPFAKDYELLNMRGVCLRRTGRLAEAVQSFDRAIRLRPNDPSALSNKGNVCNDMRDGQTAEGIFTKLTRRDPQNAEFQRALGRAYWFQRKFDDAAMRFRRAVSLKKDNEDAWLDLVAVNIDAGNPGLALESLDKGLEALPQSNRLHRAQVAALRGQARHPEARRLLESLEKRFGDTGWYHQELGRLLVDTDPATAIIHFRKSVELDPGDTEYRLALVEGLDRFRDSNETAHIEEAYTILKAAPPNWKLEPHQLKVVTEILTRSADYGAVEKLGDFASIGRQWAAAGPHTAFLGHLPRVKSAADRRELLHQHKLFGDLALERATRNPIRRPSTAKLTSKIRLGFMSSDLREHPVSFFAWPLFQHADRDRFEIYCYSFNRLPGASPLQERIASLVDGFRLHPVISDHDAAQMIANDQLDILFELGGSTHMNKIEVMAWKPAKINASWMGYPHSSGLSTIDYLLVDPFMNPSDPALLLEQPLIMPRCWIAMSELAFLESHTVTLTAPVRRNGAISFGTANNPYKYNPTMLRTWARVLSRVPGSRFIFVRPEAGSTVFMRNIRAHFEAEGVSGERIEFRPIRGTHMSHYNDIDIALDTFPQTGGTTTCEAGWMGVPTVTLIGEAIFERLSYSILTNAGLGDLCAATPEQFVDIAVALAADTDRLQAFRAGLRHQLRASPLGQTEQFAKDFYDLVANTVSNDELTAS